MRGAIEGDSGSRRLTMTASLGAIKALLQATRTTRTTSIMSGRRVGAMGVVKGEVEEVEEGVVEGVVEEVAIVAIPTTTATLLRAVVVRGGGDTTTCTMILTTAGTVTAGTSKGMQMTCTMMTCTMMTCTVTAGTVTTVTDRIPKKNWTIWSQCTACRMSMDMGTRRVDTVMRTVRMEGQEGRG